MKSFPDNFLLLLLTLAILPSPAFASNDIPLQQAQITSRPPTELWHVTLEMDLDTLFSQKRTNNYLPAKFSFKNENGEMVEWDIQVRCRGRFRRMKCEFPPLMLKFPKKQMKAAGFGKHNDVKLVTHCATSKQAWENLFREYLTYQLYAELSPVNLETRLLRITYRDTGSGEEMVTYGIYIEDVDALAERFDAKKCKDCFGMGASSFDQQNLQTHDLFQYMIGNTDWSVATMRNLKILAPKNEAAKYMVAPYDFDFSGLVNADYARPNPDYQQMDIRERIYLGGNWPAGEWASTLKLFQDKRSALMEIVDQFEMLSRKARKDIRKFLDDFYDELDDGFVPKNQYF
ncbi:MAG: hypothetical protein R2824_22320 [Saprospiraceae bacterium]|nr:hypothetical protein [Lewinella sp.]